MKIFKIFDQSLRLISEISYLGHPYSDQKLFEIQIVSAFIDVLRFLVSRKFERFRVNSYICWASGLPKIMMYHVLEVSIVPLCWGPLLCPVSAW